jgi:hypothetical protein
MRKIKELEAYFGVIRAVENRIKSVIPDAEECGWTITPLPYYNIPKFALRRYGDCFIIPQSDIAVFDLINGRWSIDRLGGYSDSIDEMADLLISIYGGLRG